MSAKRVSVLLVGVSVLALIGTLLLSMQRDIDGPVFSSPRLIQEPARVDNSWQLESVMSALPADSNNQAVRIYPNSQNSSGVWQLVRAWPSGHLDVYYSRGDSSPQRLDVAAGWRRDTFPMWVVGTQERLFVVGYDVVRNVPSGRSLSTTQPGLDLFEITPETVGEPRVLASGLDLGGLDSHVYGRLTDIGITLCANSRCVEVDFNGKSTVWPLEALARHEFVEVAFDADVAYAITRRAHDDRINGALDDRMAEYFIARLNGGEVVPELISGLGIPYKLSIKSGKPVWQQAATKATLRDLFRYEVSRMRNGGLMDFGDHNLEGRVTWSQAYYLNGMLSLLSGELDALADDALKADVQRRLKMELELLAGLAVTEYPGYRVKRYSVNREPLLFALHLGRIARILSRAQKSGLTSKALVDARERIMRSLVSFEDTVEHPIELAYQGRNYQTLAYRRGYPFWADGLVVPFNFMSGYVEGLLAFDSSPRAVDFSTELMTPLIQLEQISQHPRTWRYWWGVPYQGWSAEESPSLNTPFWAGDKAGSGLAHVTYRSMDAMALISLGLIAPERLPPDYLFYFRDLVSKGWLLPFVNEELSRAGFKASLSSAAARRYARSTSIWEIQSQVWALADLAEDFK